MRQFERTRAFLFPFDTLAFRRLFYFFNRNAFFSLFTFRFIFTFFFTARP